MRSSAGRESPDSFPPRISTDYRVVNLGPEVLCGRHAPGIRTDILAKQTDDLERWGGDVAPDSRGQGGVSYHRLQLGILLIWLRVTCISALVKISVPSRAR